MIIMNTLLLFFALPVATIILAIVLEKILRCPILTAATFFAIYLIVAFAIFDASFLVYAIAYTILAYITAVIAEFFFCKIRRGECHCNGNNTNNIQTVNLTDNAVTRIANEVAEILNNESQENESNCNCNNCNCMLADTATVNVRNNTTGGRTTWCCTRRR